MTSIFEIQLDVPLKNIKHVMKKSSELYNVRVICQFNTNYWCMIAKSRTINARISITK